jgi:hypothetical protein
MAALDAALRGQAQEAAALANGETPATNAAVAAPVVDSSSTDAPTAEQAPAAELAEAVQVEAHADAVEGEVTTDPEPAPAAPSFSAIRKQYKLVNFAILKLSVTAIVCLT